MRQDILEELLQREIVDEVRRWPAQLDSGPSSPARMTCAAGLVHSLCRGLDRLTSWRGARGGRRGVQADQFVYNDRSTRVNAATILHALPPHLKAIVRVTPLLHRCNLSDDPDLT